MIGTAGTNARCTAAGSRPSTESGTILVLFALLLVGAFGLLGVVIDGGRLRITKQQLDAGAEAAALEGLRFKDREGDVARRSRATTATARQWDDDFDPGNGDRIGLGAGSLPIVVDAQPLGGIVLAAPALDARRWKPSLALQQNLVNATHGDLVAGTFVAAVPAAEDDTFARADFTPTPAGSTGSDLADAPAFLVRLRRATQRVALDRDPGQSSSGPAFEWLWARGSAWQEPGEAGVGQSRTTGLTLRATGIASAGLALMVSNAGASEPAIAPIALRGDAASAWHLTNPGATLTLDLDANGGISLAGQPQGLALITAPRTVASGLQPAAAPPVALPAGELIVPVYADIGGQPLVIGFTLATAAIAGAVLNITRLPSQVLPTSASRISPSALDAQVALSLNPALRAAAAAVAEPVLAPVLRR